MSDTVKLIIEIPKEDYERCKKKYQRRIDVMSDAIVNGTLLDSVKAEIVALPKTYPFINHIDTYVKEDDVLQILDRIGKAESEDEE